MKYVLVLSCHALTLDVLFLCCKGEFHTWMSIHLLMPFEIVNQDSVGLWYPQNVVG